MALAKSLRLYRLVFSDDIENYRYLLSCESKKHTAGEKAAIILMNPSRAGICDGIQKTDPTVGKVLCWCHVQGIYQVDLLNLFPYRDPHPEKLSGMTYDELIGDENRANKRMKEAFREAHKIIFAWGDCEDIDPLIVSRRTEWVRQQVPAHQRYYVGEPTGHGNGRHGRSWNHNPALNFMGTENVGERRG